MTQKAVRKHSEGTQRILKEQSERNRAIRLSEPKILRLVSFDRSYVSPTVDDFSSRLLTQKQGKHQDDF